MRNQKKDQKSTATVLIDGDGIQWWVGGFTRILDEIPSMTAFRVKLCDWPGSNCVLRGKWQSDPRNLSPEPPAIMNSLSKSLPRIPASSRSFTTSIRRLAQEPAPVDPQAAKETKVSANYSNPQIRKPRRGPYADSPLPVFPLLAIFFTGSFLFYQLSKSRQGQGKSHYVLPPRDKKPPPAKEFNSNLHSEH